MAREQSLRSSHLNSSSLPEPVNGLIMTGFATRSLNSNASRITSYNVCYTKLLRYEGARSRYGAELPEGVVERLEHELRSITDMGFAAYFLIVRDIA